MLWSNIKSWAKNNGYSCLREKTQGDKNEYNYFWSKDNDPNGTGLAVSVSALATQIYNHMTNDQFIEHQNNYCGEYKI